MLVGLRLAFRFLLRQLALLGAIFYFFFALLQSLGVTVVFEVGIRRARCFASCAARLSPRLQMGLLRERRLLVSSCLSITALG